jgi:high affinity sulfate transporter 1
VTVVEHTIPRPAGPLLRALPGLEQIRSYRRSWLPRDVVAGLVLSALLVPQGMAYAELAGLPAVTGLYTSILCLVGYAIFGPSRVLVLGPDSSLGPMIAATLAPLLLAGGDPTRAVVLASMLAVLVGVVMIAAGVLRLGFVADQLSKPTQIGYLNGLALTIVVGQLPKLLGFSVDADGFLGEVAALVEGLRNGAVVPVAATLGVTCLAALLVLQRWLPKLPAVLVVVVLAALTVNLFDLSDDVDTVGVLQQGLPALTVPSVAWSDVGTLVIGALAIALVALADTMSTATAFAARRGEQVRGDQEMIGIGAANVAAGLFQGFPVSTSGSRTAVADQAGARTQLAGIVGAVVIALVLVFATSLMQYVPQPALGAVVIMAALSLADVRATLSLWRRRRSEFAVSITALLGVALLGVLPGILVAVALSIVNVFRRAWRPHQVELGQVPGTSGLHDIDRHPEALRLPGLVVHRFDAPLIFANSRSFADTVRGIAERDPTPRWILIAAEPVTDIDTTASDMLDDLDSWLGERDITLAFAELKGVVRDRIAGSPSGRQIEFFASVDDGVAAYAALTGSSWQAPEEGR